jgi:hypothetical protein
LERYHLLDYERIIEEAAAASASHIERDRYKPPSDATGNSSSSTPEAKNTTASSDTTTADAKGETAATTTETPPAATTAETPPVATAAL